MEKVPYPTNKRVSYTNLVSRLAMCIIKSGFKKSINLYISVLMTLQFQSISKGILARPSQRFDNYTQIYIVLCWRISPLYFSKFFGLFFKLIMVSYRYVLMTFIALPKWVLSIDRKVKLSPNDKVKWRRRYESEWSWSIKKKVKWKWSTILCVELKCSNRIDWYTRNKWWTNTNTQRMKREEHWKWEVSDHSLYFSMETPFYQTRQFLFTTTTRDLLLYLSLTSVVLLFI